MCGIAGLVSLDGSPVDDALLRSMAESLAHRGPDERQVWSDPDSPHVGLAHARLVVLDREGGRQPMADAAGRGRRLVFNGEIYNHRELREALTKWGHRFASDHSDTEVLLPLYDAYGHEMVDHLRGMFAFALHDRPGRRLLLARDRMGQKPLYWTRAARHFAFASELKALALVPGVSRKVSLETLHLYLQLGYVPSPRTIFDGVWKLSPGSRLAAPLDSLPDGPEAEQRYWSPPAPLDEERLPGGDAAAEYLALVDMLQRPGELTQELRRLLSEAVRIRLEADVPLGFFLSGGLDSSLVLALARQADPRRPLKTFSVAFPDERYDESAYAQLMARRVEADHTRLEVRPASLGDLLPGIATMFDEPFADSSAVPTFLMAAQARRFVTVALSGDGGDELFGGYDRYRAVRLAASLDGAPLAKWATRALGRMVPGGLDLKSRPSRFRRFTDVLALDPLARYARWVSPFHERAPLELYSPRFREAIAAGAAQEYLRMHLPADRPLEDAAMQLDTRTYLPEDVLVKVDRATMVRGLEVRSPLLDHEVAEFVMRLPARLKLGPRSGPTIQKRLLRQVAADLVPREIVSRGKMGFGVPVSAWLAGPESAWMAQRLRDGPLAASGLLDWAVASRYVEEHVRRRADHGPRLYSLLVLDEFLRTAGLRLFGC